MQDWPSEGIFVIIINWMMDTVHKVNELLWLLTLGRKISVANYAETRPRMNPRNTFVNYIKRDLLEVTP